jgi:hypothetical protein
LARNKISVLGYEGNVEGHCNLLEAEDRVCRNLAVWVSARAIRMRDKKGEPNENRPGIWRPKRSGGAAAIQLEH